MLGAGVALAAFGAAAGVAGAGAGVLAQAETHSAAVERTAARKAWRRMKGSG
jgi:hypothetical protein